jgi:hypothetical protein
MRIGAPDGFPAAGTALTILGGAHDVIANAVAGVLVLVAGAGGAPLQSRGAWLLAKRRAGEASIGTADPSEFNPVLDRGSAKGWVDNRVDWRRWLDAIVVGRTPKHPDGPPTRPAGMVKYDASLPSVQITALINTHTKSAPYHS